MGIACHLQSVTMSVDDAGSLEKFYINAFYSR